MQKFNKYRIFKKYNSYALKKFPLRVLKFKKQKWLSLQRKLKRFLKPAAYKSQKGKFFKKKRLKKFNVIFKNAALCKTPINRWTKYKRSFSNELLTKRTFYVLYQKAIGVKFLRQQTKNKEFKENWQITRAFLIKPLYKLDVLLWFLNFFGSTYEARQYMLGGKVFVNNNLIKTPIFLTVGDIIQVSLDVPSNFFFLESLRKKYTQKKKFFSFVEIDYYLKTMIIIKGADEIGIQDGFLMLQDKIKIRSFKHLF